MAEAATAEMDAAMNEVSQLEADERSLKDEEETTSNHGSSLGNDSNEDAPSKAKKENP